MIRQAPGFKIEIESPSVRACFLPGERKKDIPERELEARIEESWRTLLATGPATRTALHALSTELDKKSTRSAWNANADCTRRTVTQNQDMPMAYYICHMQRLLGGLFNKSYLGLKR
jgi:hypothetical protein